MQRYISLWIKFAWNNAYKIDNVHCKWYEGEEGTKTHQYSITYNSNHNNFTVDKYSSSSLAQTLVEKKFLSY